VTDATSDSAQEPDSTPEPLAVVQNAVDARQNELKRCADSLAKHAKWLWRLSTFSKVALVVLGALAASKGAADQLWGSPNRGVLTTYTVIGLLVATVAGLEAALHFERRATVYSQLAANAQSALRRLDAEWYEKVGVADPVGDRVEAALMLISEQDDVLTDIQRRAADAGHNLAAEVRELDRSDKRHGYSA
jgi:hypothetical protein